MIKKLLSVFISILMVMGTLGASFTALAAPVIESDVFDEDASDEAEKTTKPHSSNNDEEIFPTDFETTEKETVKVTDSKRPSNDTTKRPGKKPGRKPAKHQNNNHNNNNNNNNRPQENTSTTINPSETTTLPEGAFFVYLEANNSTKRLKRIMTEPGLVPEPPEPERKGYFFDGWYADEKFSYKWNFFTDIAKKETTLYAKWLADKSTIEYKITVDSNIKGGKIRVNPYIATAGEPILITVIPDNNNRLKQGSITINGKNSDVLSFIMPSDNVVIGAEFEKIPPKVAQEEKSIAPFIILAAVLIVVIIIILIVIFISRKRRMLLEMNVDENGTIVLDDDGDDWVDESIVVEDGFKQGKKVKGKTEPDYGAPDAEYDDEED